VIPEGAVLAELSEPDFHNVGGDGEDPFADGVSSLFRSRQPYQRRPVADGPATNDSAVRI